MVEEVLGWWVWYLRQCMMEVATFSGITKKHVFNSTLSISFIDNPVIKCKIGVHWTHCITDEIRNCVSCTGSFQQLSCLLRYLFSFICLCMYWTRMLFLLFFLFAQSPCNANEVSLEYKINSMHSTRF